MLPNFIIIGAPRCATTFLAQNLNDHPDIFMAQGAENYAAGDIHFFDVSTIDGKANFNKGLTWYSKLFDGVKNETKIGEKTADYLGDPNSATLIKEYLGDVQLILMLRDPVERAWSHYKHSRHRLPLVMTFDQLPESDNDVALHILSSGNYAKLLRPYLNTQKQENIIVVLQEDFVRNPEETMKYLCDVLSVSNEFKFPKLHSTINQSSSGFIAYLVAKVGRAVRLKLPKLHEVLINGPMDKLLKSVILRMRGKSKNKESKNDLNTGISSEVEQQLRDFYRDDVTQLEKIINRPLREIWWKE